MRLPEREGGMSHCEISFFFFLFYFICLLLALPSGQLLRAGAGERAGFRAGLLSVSVGMDAEGSEPEPRQTDGSNCFYKLGV